MGHARHPNGARTHGDFLFVTLTADAFVTKGPGKSVFSENLRAEMLAALSMVDYVAINHAPDAEDLLQRLRPDVYAKGSDYRDAEADVAGKINREREAGFTTLTLRPATVCGYSQRLRLDLTVNILTNHAINNGRIRVFGGSQRRPNIHIEDMTDLYVKCLLLPAEKIDGGIYNAGYENHRVIDIAEMVRDVIGSRVEIAVEETDDLRSYHISSRKIAEELGFLPIRDISTAVDDLNRAFENGLVPESMNANRYYNIKTMQNLGLA